MPTKIPDPLDTMVGARIRVFRIHRRISQTELADQIGVTFQQVQKYEKGTNRIGAGRLQQIAHTLQVPVTFFFEGGPGAPQAKGTAPSPAYVTDFLATRDGPALIKALTQIKDAKLRRCIIDLVEGIADQP